MKHIPNIITVLRLLGAVSLLLCNPESAAFWVIYGLCGVSDMADGYLARRLHTESKTGAVLDSVADICFVACCAIRLLPALQIPLWLWIWAGLIIIIKIINQISALFWSIVPIVIVAGIATYAAIQEGHLIRKRCLIDPTSR